MFIAFLSPKDPIGAFLAMAPAREACRIASQLMMWLMGEPEYGGSGGTKPVRKRC